MTKVLNRLGQLPWHKGLGGCLLVMLAGCATQPTRLATSWGTLPQPSAGAFALSPATAAMDPALVAQMEKCLGEAGLQHGTKPRLLVDLGYTVAPASVAVSGSDRAELQPVTTEGLLPKGGGDRETLTLVITDIADGHDVFRASLVQRKPAPDTNKLPPITQALCSFARTGHSAQS